MRLEIKPFGTLPDGRAARLFLMDNEAGMTVGVSDLGADLVSCCVPDASGAVRDVVLGYADARGYAANGALFGAVVGRVANRIADARFELDGTTYELARSEGAHSNHSMPDVYFHRLWEATPLDDGVRFELLSPDGDQGFPGELAVSVTYRLDAGNRLRVDYDALPARPTLVNLTCHAYWNLNGHASGSVLDHTLQLDADRYLPADAALIPTGEILPVAGTDLDFSSPRTFSSGLGAGYDTYLLLTERSGGLRRAAHLAGDASGISLELLTDAPGLQVYTGGFLDEKGCKDGAAYGPGSGVALEAQFPPDAIHHPTFPQPVFTPEHPFRSTTVFALSSAGGSDSKII